MVGNQPGQHLAAFEVAAEVPEHARRTSHPQSGVRVQGWSEESASPRDGVQSANQLHTLLEKAGQHGRYVLVGHSTGGTYAMTYAARYPDQVVGMVRAITEGISSIRTSTPLPSS
jgi:pimeloyl-ACP methyl ester carboxylesterase